MDAHPFPILEFDPERDALIEPRRVLAPADGPRACVLAIFPTAVNVLAESGLAVPVRHLATGVGPWPVYHFASEAGPVSLCNPGVGGAFAAIRLEELIATGCRAFVLCGTCGVLDRNITCGHLLVPTSAVRDEGTSYHYLPPGREVAVAPLAVAAVESALRDHGYDPLPVKTWTTDGVYRETPARIRRRREEGCLTVEMEAASMLAVAQFRGVPLGIILWAGDDVSGAEWDKRGLGTAKADAPWVIELAAAAALRLLAECGA